MKGKIFFVVTALMVISLLVMAFGCAAPAPAPSKTPAPTTTPAAKPPEVIKWKGQNNYGSGIPLGYGTNFIEWVKRATNGRLVIELSAPGSIAPVPETFDAVSKGVVDFVGNSYAGLYMGKFPEQDIEAALPFGYVSLQETWDFLYKRGAFKIFQDVYAEKNMKWFPSITNATYHMGAGWEIKSIRDVKGKKIRAIGTAADYIKALGGAPVYVPPQELYMASKLGTIDGCVFSTEGLDAYKLQEVWKSYIKQPNATALITHYLINLDSWKKLPADIQELLQRELRHVDLEQTMNGSVEVEKIERDALKNYGVKPVFLSDSESAEVMEIGQTIWDNVAKNSPRCAQLIDIVKKLAKDNGRIK